MLTCPVIDSYGNLRMITWTSSNVDMSGTWQLWQFGRLHGRLVMLACQVLDSYGSLEDYMDV